MRATTLLTNRDAVNLAQLRDYLVGVLSTGQAEVINEVLYVDGTNGNDAYDGKRPDRAFKTITAALVAALAFDVIAVFPGTYAEHVTMSVSNVTLLGLGSQPKDVRLTSAVDVATAYITLTASGCVVSNLRISNLHANNVNGITITGNGNLIDHVELFREPTGVVAQDVGIALVGPAATSYNNRISDCRFDFCTNGIIFTASVTQAINTTIEDCVFTNGVTTDIFDVTDVAVDYLRILRCYFLGTPTKFVEVDSAACTGGCMADCVFNSATHAVGTIDIDNGIIPVCSRTLAGISIGVPA